MISHLHEANIQNNTTNSTSTVPNLYLKTREPVNMHHEIGMELRSTTPNTNQHTQTQKGAQ